jgi:hypothetical protein
MWRLCRTVAVPIVLNVSNGSPRADVIRMLV